MGRIWVKEFTGGLDSRRMPVTTSGGVLVKAENGHISRGGDFEKRAAFVPTYTLPAGTVGLAQTFATGIYVFGSDATPAGLPSGVSYQRLQHPTDTGQSLTRVLSYDLYAGKLYVVGEFSDGGVFHFYDGAGVTDWFDGRARATFTVTDGAVTPATFSSGSFEVLGGTSGAPNQITDITIDGISIFNTAGPINYHTDNVTTASDIASQINLYTSSPNYTATTNGQTVILTAAASGATANGKTILISSTGDFQTGNVQLFSGGAAMVTSKLNDLKVGGVSVISAPVSWSTSNEATATAIANAVNSYTSSPDYSASVNGAQVSVVVGTAGAAANGRAFAFSLVDGLAVSPPSGLVLSGGQDGAGFQAGPYVKTVGSKVYSVSGSNLHFSGIDQPTKWTTDAVGAGFIDMSKQSSGAEKLVALGEYQNYLAIFAGRVVLIWYVDPDPTLNRKVQVLKNTGTLSGLSVTQFGDNDLFYIDRSGLRSLRARDASNAAATSDIGVPIDTVIKAKIQSLTTEERENIIGAIEVEDGRFWLIAKDVIYVFSFFNGAKVSAWTTYTPSYVDESGAVVPFDVESGVVFGDRVYVRSADTIYVYGGIDSDFQYDATVAEAWLPDLDANNPTRVKEWQGVDAALEGEWEVRFAMQPTNEDASDKIATLFETTYNQERVPSLGRSTHISPRFKTVGTGYARLSAVVIHYASDADED